MAHITPNNFNMYISSLKLKVNESTVYGPQLTRVSRVSSETGRIIFHKMKVKSLSSPRNVGVNKSGPMVQNLFCFPCAKFKTSLPPFQSSEKITVGRC